MDIDIRVDNDTLHVKLSGPIDTEGGAELTAKFMEFAERSSLKHGIFNLQEVPTTTSAGIGKLLKFFKYFDSRKGTMKIKGISESLKKQFEEIHMDQILTIE